ncbi:MAG: glucosamine-6-phosphate deaminase [Acidobacteriota bacterium]
MSRKGSAPEIRVFGSGREVACEAAALLAAMLRRRLATTLVLASGKTMMPVYRELVRLHRAGRAPFRRADAFVLDELAVPAGDPRSFRSFMDDRLFSRVDIDPRRIHALRGDAPDPERECARFERELRRAGPADLAIAGIGRNGHVAYLEPGASLAPRTSVVRLSDATRRSLRDDGMRPVPREALTMGIETILAARRILLVATGRAKARALASALEGKVGARCPASYLSLHPALTVLADGAAARGLDRLTSAREVSPISRRAPRSRR